MAFAERHYSHHSSFAEFAFLLLVHSYYTFHIYQEGLEDEEQTIQSHNHNVVFDEQPL